MAEIVEFKRNILMRGDYDCIQDLSIDDNSGRYVRESDYEALRAEVKMWKMRMMALVGENSPDTAGNRIISLKSDLAAAVEVLRKIEDHHGEDETWREMARAFLERV